MPQQYITKELEYPDFVKKENIVSWESLDLRYFLRIPFNTTSSEKKDCLVVILKNPSAASTTGSDRTINNVCRFAHNNNYSAVIILNLFPYRATNARSVQTFYGQSNYAQIMANNLNTIKWACKNKDVIFAWGTDTIRGRRFFPGYYDTAIRNITTTIIQNTHFVDFCHCCNQTGQCNNPHMCNPVRYPLHGQIWDASSSKMIPY